MPNPTTSKIDQYGQRSIVLNFLFIFLSLPILMISAGTINWIKGWLYFVLIALYEVSYILFLLKINPELLNESGKFVKEGTKKFDRVYAALYIPMVYLILIISAFDAVRFTWTHIPLEINILGIFLFILACPLSFWALSVNPYFECTVHTQTGHKVCKTGPYKLSDIQGILQELCL